MSDVRTRFDLAAGPDPDGVVQHHARHREAGMQPLPPLHPQTQGADRARRPRAAVPRVADHAGGLDRRVDRHPGRGARRLPAVEAVAAVPRDAAGAGAADTPAHIYFKYEGVSPAGSHKPNTAVAAGLLQQGSRHPADRDRDRRRAMGLGAGVRVPDVRPGVPRVHGEGLVRAEAVPADHHGDVRRRGSSPRRATRRTGGKRDPRGAPRLDRFPRDRDQRGGRGRGHQRRHELRARQRAGPRAAAPDRDRPGGAEADGDGGRAPDVVIGCVGGGSNYAGISYPFMAEKLRGETLDMRVPGHRAGRVPDADEGAVRLRLRRHGADDADRADVHARATTSCRRRCTRAGCATTATRPRCRCW